MLVVADTTPLNYLVLIGQVTVLASLYEQVVIPNAVATELRHPKAPEVVRAWIASPPSWCTIRQAQRPPDRALMPLGAGEREAIVLAEELGAGALLTDDLEGREAARHRGIEVTGTLGILERAAQRALLDLPTVIAQLQATTFYGAPDIIAAMLARDAARTKPMEPP
jgi:predicted nucleic acid-binding protein